MDLANLINPATIFLTTMLVWVIAEGVVKKFLSKDELAKVEAIVQIAVMAAEQLAKIQSIKPDERKGYALNLVRRELERYNISVSESLVNAILEAKVLGIKITKYNS